MSTADLIELISRLPRGWTFKWAAGADVGVTQGLGIESLYFAVPDLHGAVEKARAVIFLLETLGVKRAVFLGDMIDRGSDSSGTVVAVAEASVRNPSWVVLRGNHEQMFIESYDSGVRTDLPDTLFSQLKPSERGHYAELFRALPSYHETTSLVFVHGGVSWSHWTTDISSISQRELLWSYDITPRWTGKKLVRGHQRTSAPEEFKTHVSLETYGWRADRALTIGVLADADVERKLIGWLEYRNYGNLDSEAA